MISILEEARAFIADPTTHDHSAALRREDMLARLDQAIAAAEDPKNGGRAIIEGDAVTVRFPIDALGDALEGAWAMRVMDTRYKVSDAAEFAKEFMHELNSEDEQGTTLIHRMADRAFINCIEGGAFGIERHEDQDDGKVGGG